jgi:hypothetical protein
MPKTPNLRQAPTGPTIYPSIKLLSWTPDLGPLAKV